MITALRPDTFKNIQTDAGAFLVDFDLDTPQTVQELKAAVAAALKSNTGVLGATRGGGSFRAVPTMRSIDVDGKRYEFVGSSNVDFWDIRLTGTLVEIPNESFQKVLMAAEHETEGEKTTVTLRTSIDKKDYIPKLCWIGDTSEGYMAIELTNALNTVGANFTFVDRGEGTLPFEFVAHQASVEEAEYAPFRAVFLRKTETQANVEEE